MLKKLPFVVFLAVVLTAITVSASQLITKSSAIRACGTTCTSNLDCGRPCFCLFRVEGAPTGGCTPEGNPTARKPVMK